jgi:NAD(P)-dependent dehydrogenase (short-subunit alcohol dehydrogenase family)
MISYDFTGKHGVVTGAGGGMGEAIAQALLTAGARVTAIDIKPKPDSLTGAVSYHQGDVTNEAFVTDAIRSVGMIDYLVNVAGVLWFDRDRSLLDMDLAVWDQVFAINLRSMVLTARAAVPQMTSGGAMVHFSTIQWLRGDPVPQDAYQASKAGVCALSKSLAMQLAAKNIRSNAILPGPTVSPLQARWDSDAKKAAVASYVPLGRLGSVEDMAAATLFLLSDHASFITGIELPVDGGMLMRP